MSAIRKIALILISLCFLYPFSTLLAAEEEPDSLTSSLSLFPIILYDSDIGFGLGGKGVLKNHFKRKESFDLILFGSSKGEQWYVFTFSIPDFEIRQGTVYSIAFDLRLEFDKHLKSNFFSIGNDSEDNDWQFPLETSKLELTLGRAFTRQVIFETGFFFNYASVYDYEDVNTVLTSDVPGAGENLTLYMTARIRWDTRESQIHPHRGWKVNFNFDLAAKSFGSAFDFQRYRLDINKCQELSAKGHIMAARLWMQHIEGTAPYYEQSVIGGAWTGRGFKADRFIDKAFMLASLEYRFLLYNEWGGVLFTDAGRVSPSIMRMSLNDWKIDWGLGLRYYLDNFLVRFDTGVSNEGMRIFFNFGHVF